MTKKNPIFMRVSAFRKRLNELLRKGGSIIRILAAEGDEVLCIPCRGTGSPMPGWCRASDFEGYVSCSEEELQKINGVRLMPEEELTPVEQGIARQRYTIIAPVLGCLEDEKNIRWAVNKFVYSRKKNSLNTAYKMMLREKYTDSDGVLADEYPSFNQFRYWYAKNKNYMSYYIAREGKSGFMRNHRVLVGDCVQAFAAAPGVGMADSTVMDLYVVSDDRSRVVGRPVLAALLDGYSGLCLGYSLGWEGGEYSLQSLMVNVVTDKKSHCHKFGVEITGDEWPSALPGCIVTDRGSDYAGSTYGQLAELGVRIINLEAYRADEKGVVEKFFDTIQNFFKPYLKGAGVVAGEYLERGSYFGDYKEKSCLTLREFETVLIRCIVHYNSGHIVSGFPYTEEMIKMGIKPYSNCIWEYGIENLRGCNVLPAITKEQVILTLLPRTRGSFTRFGLKVNGLRYFCDGYFERCLKGGKAVVAYDRVDVSCVWLYENGKYTRFGLIESRYQGKDLEAVLDMKGRQKEIVDGERHRSIQSEIDLMAHIQTIKHNALTGTGPDAAGIRETREEERKNKHINYAKEAGLHDD